MTCETTEYVTDDIDLSKYNGFLTVSNPAKGTHRTFRISTQRRGNWKGSRKVAYLYGSNNETDYRTFGYLKDGVVKLFNKNIGNKELTMFAQVLNFPQHNIESFGLEYKFSVRCRVCNRTLTDPTSIDLGIGPYCRKRN